MSIPIHPTEEKQLVEQARKDPEAFGELFEIYYPKIFGYVLKRVAMPAVADDITSETFSKALAKLWQFRWQGAPFSAWLYRIAVNEINAYFRKGEKYKTISLDILVEDSTAGAVDTVSLQKELEEAEETLEQHQNFLRVQKILATLPLPYQEVISLRFFEEKKISEIAQILGKKEGTIKSLLSRGLERLRDAAQPFHGQDIIESERSKNKILKTTSI